MIANGPSGQIYASHLHQTALGMSGGVVLNLFSGIDGNEISLEITGSMLTPAIINALLTGELYANVHTPGFPGGELRGQIFRLAREGYGYDLCTEQETSPVDAPNATGAGMASIDRNQSNAHVMVVVSGLTGDMTGAHIHEAEAGMIGGVVIPMTDLFANGGAFTYFGGDDFGPAISTKMKDGNHYVNIHTAMHPGGEIRGQIVKDLTCSLPTAANEREAVFQQIELSPVPVSEELTLRFSALSAAEAKVSVFDLTGRLVFSQTYPVTIDGNTIRIDVSDYKPGFYLVNLSDGVNSVSQKFIR